MVKIGDIELSEFPIILAPMEDVSDPPFRVLCKENGADLMFTEFVSSEGLIREAAKSIKKLDIFEYERPIGIQIFGSNIESMKLSAEIIEKSKPDIVDLNFGCPVKKVVDKGAGASILQDIPKMVKMTEAVVKQVNLPVTVKTRLGWDENSINIVETAERLQDVGIKALTIHGRTRKQMYKGNANWKPIAEVKNNQRMKIPIFGNGDIDSPEKALEYKDTYGIDGIMIGRASIGYPWIFNEIKYFLKNNELLKKPDIIERVKIAKKHLNLSIKWKGEVVGILEMKKHYSNYFKGIPNFKDFKIKLVTASNFDEIINILNEIERNLFV